MTKRKTTNPQFNREFRETAVKLALAGDKPVNLRIKLLTFWRAIWQFLPNNSPSHTP